MKLEISTNEAPAGLIRKLGYHETNNFEKRSYQKRLRPGQVWPRYHIYIEEKDGRRFLDLHVDQKAETRHYRATSAHNGEYSGPLVEAEIERIKGLL